jgi:hypothetical protein
MDTRHYDDYPHPRSPFSPWLLVALTGIVLTAVTISSTFTADSRDFIARHQAVHAQQAL